MRFSIRYFIAAISLLALPAMGVLPMPAKQVSVVTNGWENIVPEGGSNDAQNALGWIDTNWQKVNSNSWAILAGADTNTVQAVFDYVDYLLNITNGGFGTIVVANSNVTPQIVFNWIDDNMALATNLTIVSNWVDAVSSTSKSSTNPLITKTDLSFPQLIGSNFLYGSSSIRKDADYVAMKGIEITTTNTYLSSARFSTNGVFVTSWGYLRGITNNAFRAITAVLSFGGTEADPTGTDVALGVAGWDGVRFASAPTDPVDSPYSLSGYVPPGVWYAVRAIASTQTLAEAGNWYIYYDVKKAE